MHLADSEKDFQSAKANLDKAASLMQAFFAHYLNVESVDFEVKSTSSMEVFSFLKWLIKC